MAEPYRFAAFISYSSKDSGFARKLHRALELWRIPKSLGPFDLLDGGGKPNRVYPVFRDREELSVGDLGVGIKAALRGSNALIVVCTPDATSSLWVAAEIDYFISLGRRHRIFAIIPDRAPSLSRDIGVSDCLPGALRMEPEPLVADARRGADGVANARLKLVAGLVGTNAGVLANRDRAARRSRAAFTAGAAIALLSLLGAGAWRLGLQARDSGDSRAAVYAREADRLIAEGRFSEATLFALAGDPAARRDPIDAWMSPNGHADARSALVSAVTRDRLLRVFVGNAREIRALALSPDNRRLATVGHDRMIMVWDPESGRPLHSFDVGAEVSTLAIDRSGRRFIVGLHQGGGEILDAASGHVLGRFEIGREATLATLPFHAGDGFISVNDRGIDFWDIATLNLRRHLTAPVGIQVAALSTDDRHLALGLSDGSVVVYDAVTGVGVMTLRGHARAVRALAFSQDGARLISGGDDGVVNLWDMQTEQMIKTVSPAGGAVWSVAFSPDRQTAVAGLSDGRTVLLDCWFGDVIESLRAGSGNVYAVAFSSDAGTIAAASADGKVRVWRANLGRSRAVIDSNGRKPSLPTLAGDGLHPVWLSSEGNVVAFNPRGSTIVVADAVSGTALANFDGLALQPSPAPSYRRPDVVEINSVALSNDRRFAVVGVNTGAGALWEFIRGHASMTRTWSETGFALTGDQQVARVASGVGSLVITRLDTDERPRTIANFATGVRIWAISDNGLHAITALRNGDYNIWDLGLGRVVAVLSEPSVEVDDGGWSGAVAISNDGDHVAVLDAAHAVRLWNVRTGLIERVLTRGEADVPITFSSNGRFLLTGRGIEVGLWDVASGRLLEIFEGHRLGMTSLAFAANNRVISGGGDGALISWDINPIVLAGPDEQVRLACERLRSTGEDAQFGQSDIERFPDLRTHSNPCGFELQRPTKRLTRRDPLETRFIDAGRHGDD